jgi:hypothetical protein
MFLLKYNNFLLVCMKCIEINFKVGILTNQVKFKDLKLKKDNWNNFKVFKNKEL